MRMSLATRPPALGWRILAVPLAMLCAAGHPCAQALEPLTLPQAIEQALARHPELAAAQHELDATRGAAEQAGNRPNPELSASVEDTRQASRITAVQLSQRLELGGKRGARVQAAQWAQTLAQTRLDSRRAELQAQVRTAFWAASAARSRLDLAQRSSELAGQGVDAAAKRVAAGKVSPLEETRARLAMASVALDAAQAELELAQARSRLGLLIGQGEAPLPPALIASAQAMPHVSIQDVAQRLPQSPALVEAQIEVRRRDALVELERSRQVPDVTVGLGTQRNNELGRQQTLLALSLPLPVFDRNQGALKEAVARADQARDELAAVKLRLSADVQAASSRLDSAQRQALLIEQHMLPQARLNHEASTTGFSLGKFSFLDVLDAQRTLFQAQAQHLRAIAEAQAAAAELDRLLGAPLPSQPSPDH